MSVTIHKDKTKSKRYRTLILIIGVIVAIAIGFSASASSLQASSTISGDQLLNSVSEVGSIFRVCASLLNSVL